MVGSMFKELSFALFAIGKNIQNSAELRTSFIVNIIGMMLNNSAFIVVWVFFVFAVGNVGGWTAIDIVGLQGFTALTYGVIFSVLGGIPSITDYVVKGGFDQLMLAPKNLLVRIATARFSVSAVGDITYGVVCLGIYLSIIHAGVVELLIMVLGVAISTTAFLAALLVIQSSAFLFTDAEGVVRGIFDFFLTPTLFHGGAFQGGMRFFFTFLIPSLVIGTLPVEAVKSSSWGTLILSSVIASFWFMFALFIFYRCVRKYTSTNFMTFGG